MKRILIILFVLFGILLASCGATQAPTSTVEDASQAPTSTVADTSVSVNLSADYENALPVSSQLAIGTMKLDGTAQAVALEQAKTLVPLYQALRSIATSGAQQEISALETQIEGAMTSEQLTAIRDMQLTLTDMQTWAAENGVTLGQNGAQPPAGVQPGAGQSLSPEARATLQAANGITGQTPSSVGGAAIMDAIVGYLESKAQ